MALFRCTATGKLSTSEVFAHTHWFEDDVAGSPAAFSAQAVTFLSDLLSIGLRAWYLTGIAWDGLRIEQFNPLTGAQLDAIAPAFGPTFGTAASAGVRALPFEVSTCVSLRTGTATKSGRGRFYLPPPGTDSLNTGTNGQYLTTFLNDHRNAVQTAYNNITTLTCRGVVVSKVGGPPWVLRDIISIDVGSVPDAQRRRRNRLVETRLSAAIS